MGLLDDAIREHLELKRKHGADPEDVARQEQEALGPGQRNEFAQPEAPEERAEPRAARRRAPSGRSRAARGPVDELPEGEPGSRRRRPRPRRRATTRTRGSTRSRDEVPADEALEQRRDAPRRRGEDVLEETPDFLQETPEHDRLWFEQKPPRDFDWDK